MRVYSVKVKTKMKTKMDEILVAVIIVLFGQATSSALASPSERVQSRYID